MLFSFIGVAPLIYPMIRGSRWVPKTYGLCVHTSLAKQPSDEPDLLSQCGCRYAACGSTPLSLAVSIRVYAMAMGSGKLSGLKLNSVYPVGFVAGGFVVKVRMRNETEFGWGECQSHEIGVIERSTIDPSEGSLGISLAEGKSILEKVQRAVCKRRSNTRPQ